MFTIPCGEGERQEIPRMIMGYIVIAHHKLVDIECKKLVVKEDVPNKIQLSWASIDISFC